MVRLHSYYTHSFYIEHTVFSVSEVMTKQVPTQENMRFWTQALNGFIQEQNTTVLFRDMQLFITPWLCLELLLLPE